MRARLVCLLVVLLAGAAGAGSALAAPPEIVIYDSFEVCSVRPALDAAHAIGAEAHAYLVGWEDEWIADVQDGADIVVFDCNDDYTLRGNPIRYSRQLDAITTYLNTNPCGRAVVALWFMALDPVDPLWDLMDIQFCSDYSETLPIYQWTSHPIWDGVPNPIQKIETGWWEEGAKVEPLPGGIAIGGFTTAAASCEAGLVVSHDLRTVYIGEVGGGALNDDDADGVMDWQEMYENIFIYLLTHGPSATEGATWGQIKSLYY